MIITFFHASKRTAKLWFSCKTAIKIELGKWWLGLLVIHSFISPQNVIAKKNTKKQNLTKQNKNKYNSSLSLQFILYIFTTHYTA